MISRHASEVSRRNKDVSDQLFESGLAFTLLGQADPSRCSDALRAMGHAADQVSANFFSTLTRTHVYGSQPHETDTDINAE